MTTHRIKRCEHCLVTYTYQASGWGCDRNYNDKMYCPDCKKVVVEALEKVPARVERFFKPYDGITLEEIKDILKKEEEERKNSRGLYFKRVAVPLYDMKDPDNHNHTGFVTVDGKEILYSYWDKKDDVEIKVEMERDLITNEERPWCDYN